MKKRKTKNTKQSPIIKNIKKYWSGEVSLPASFWGFGIIGLFFAGIPSWLVMSVEMSEAEMLFYMFYLLLFYIFLIFVWVGLWRSARNYIIKKEKRGLSPGWGRGAQVWIVLSIIGFIRRLVFG